MSINGIIIHYLGVTSDFQWRYIKIKVMYNNIMCEMNVLHGQSNNQYNII